jgi:hypothetical protein
MVEGLLAAVAVVAPLVAVVVHPVVAAADAAAVDKIYVT